METEPASREFCLSAAYDMLPVNIILPEDREEMALTLNGKKKKCEKECKKSKKNLKKYKKTVYNLRKCIYNILQVRVTKICTKKYYGMYGEKLCRDT